ncbi:MAG TPA: zinc dependent phospholipase C family protein, partial [Terriglobales bacterium]
RFSDMVHYVRSGDFVTALIDQATDLNGYAFALGALSHYASDIKGHPAVNRSVAIEYPALERKYGKRVTYAQDKVAHLKTEFGFDVVQVAKNRYAPQSYHDFIGFKVDKDLLERAFQQTYGVPLKSVMPHEDLAIGTYRHAVSGFIPKLTKVALATRGQRMAREFHNFNRQKFLYHLKRTDYEREWGKDYTRPGVGSKVIAFLLHLVPRVGPFRGLQYKDPTPQTEDLYFASVNQTIEYYRELADRVRKGNTDFADMDLDTGKPSVAREYTLADETYAGLLDVLDEDGLERTSPELRESILQFYKDAPPPKDRCDQRHWQKTQQELDALRGVRTTEKRQDNIPLGEAEASE